MEKPRIALENLTDEQRVIALRYLALNRHDKRRVKALAVKRRRAEIKAAKAKAAKVRRPSPGEG